MKNSNSRCLYVPIEQVGTIPEGIVLNCRWNGECYDRAYLSSGEWRLMWNDKVMPTPTGIQVRRGSVADSQT